MNIHEINEKKWNSIFGNEFRPNMVNITLGQMQSEQLKIHCRIDKENVTTKTQVKEKLGEPKSTSTEDSLDVWTYDMDSVNSKLSTITGIAKALGNDTSKAEKVVELKFDGDVMKSYAVVDAAG